MLNKVFVTSSNASQTYWLVIDAALANETFPYGVYTAGNKAKASSQASQPQAAQPQAAQPAYSENGEYEYEPAYHTIDTTLGEVRAHKHLTLNAHCAFLALYHRFMEQRPGCCRTALFAGRSPHRAREGGRLFGAYRGLLGQAPLPPSINSGAGRL